MLLDDKQVSSTFSSRFRLNLEPRAVHRGGQQGQLPSPPQRKLNLQFLLLRLPVGYGGVLNSPRFWFFFPVSKVGLPLMGDTAVQ